MARVFSTIVLLLLISLALEALARIDDYVAHGASFFGSYSQESLYTYDILGKKGKPNARYLKYKLNSKGYRGPELSSVRPIIATVGSSETFGLYESEGVEWPRQLEKNLRAKGMASQVVNLALPGMLMSTFEVRLDSLLREIDPDIFVMCPGPVGYLYRQPEKLDVDDKISSNQGGNKFESRFIAKFREWLKRRIPTWLKPYFDRAYIEFQLGSKTEIYETAPQQLLNLFETDLIRIVKILKEKGKVVVLVTHASKISIDSGFDDAATIAAWRKFYPQLSEMALLEMEYLGNEIIRGVAQQLSIPIVDLANLLPKHEEVFADFVHFTDNGAASAAEIIGKGVEEAVRLSPRSEKLN